MATEDAKWGATVEPGVTESSHGLEKGNDNASDFTPKCTMLRSNAIATLRRL